MSKANEVRERIADLSELITATRKTLADLGEDGHPYAKVLRANLQATIEAAQRERARAKGALDNARGLDAAAEILAKVNTQAREGRHTTKWAEMRAQTQRALERAVAQDAAAAILASASKRAKEQNARAKKGT